MTKIGAVMPTYQMAEFIVEAIDSIIGQVDQLVVVDDGSTDGTVDLLDKTYGAGLDVIRHTENFGTATAINAGIQLLWSTGVDFNWLTWVSSDNVHYPTWREQLLGAASFDVGAVYSAFDARGDVKPHKSYRPYDPTVLGTSIACFFGPSFIIRSELWQTHRGKHCHDYDNWCRVEEECWSRNLRIVGVEESQCMYRVHPGQATKRRGGFDAHHWLAECKKRRSAAGITPP